MADKTKIERTDATWNPIIGCSVLSPGCTNCYAMKLAGTRLRTHPSRAGLTVDSKAGPVWNGEVRLIRKSLYQPSDWKRPRMIFAGAHTDIFHPKVPDDWLLDVITVMAANPQHIFQILTKRPQRMREFLSRPDLLEDIYANWSTFSGAPREVYSWPLHNVWTGVSVEDNQRANERVWDLIETPSRLRWVSAEPLLGNLDDAGRWLRHIDWVVVGGESGPGARPMHPHWAYALRDDCERAGVPFLFKQWGNWIIASHENGHYESSMATNNAIWLDTDGRQAKPSCDGMSEPIGMFRVPKSRAGRLLDGKLHDAFPAREQP